MVNVFILSVADFHLPILQEILLSFGYKECQLDDQEIIREDCCIFSHEHLYFIREEKPEILYHYFKNSPNTSSLLITSRQKYKKLADVYIDKDNISKDELINILKKRRDKQLEVKLFSFGFNYGTPNQLDSFIDARILPNPYWTPTLKNKTGLDKDIIDYMFSYPITTSIIHSYYSYLLFLLKEVEKKDNVTYSIGVACSGGQHRSVFLAEELGKLLKDKYCVDVIHCDLERNRKKNG